jgi:hypothetical protein
MPRVSSSSVWRRAGAGAVTALAMFAIPSLILLGLFLFGGRHQALRDGELDVLVALLTYPTGAALAGAVIGAAGDATRHLVVAIIVGIVAITPMVSGVVASMDNGLTAWTGMHTALLVIMSVAFGAALGYGAWKGPEKGHGHQRARSQGTEPPAG